MKAIQGFGRPGYCHLGVPMGGAMDKFALHAANLLLGSDEDAAGVDSAFLRLELKFTENATVAISGVEFPPGSMASKCRPGPRWT